MTTVIHGERWHPWRHIVGGWKRVSERGVAVHAYRLSGHWLCDVWVGPLLYVDVSHCPTRTAAFRAAMSAYNITIGRKP